MAVGITRNDRIASFVLEKAAPYISNELKRNDGIIAVLGSRGRIKMVQGSDLFEERVEYKENTNTDWRSKFAQIDTNQQDNWLTAKYGQAVLSGSVVINQVEQAQNTGAYAISNMMTAMVENAANTISRKVADALRTAAPGATSPESLYTIVTSTAFGAQATTTGGLLRSTYPTWWQNQYNNTAADLSANAGLEVLMSFYWQSVAKGASRKDQPDFGLCSGTLFAALAAYSETLKQFTTDAELAKLGFTAIKVLNMSVIADPSITAGDFYMLNTNHLKIQCLQMEGTENVGDAPDTIPVSFGPLQQDIDSLNKVKCYSLVMNLTCDSLQRQGVMDNCS